MKYVYATAFGAAVGAALDHLFGVGPWPVGVAMQVGVMMWALR